MSFEEYMQKKVDDYNSTHGSLKGYDCPKCLNKGVIAYMGTRGYFEVRDCKCKNLRRAQKLIKESGLENEITRCTFEAFETKEAYQQYMYDKARDFLDDNEAKCFYIGGQSGAGKTHICTAMVSEFLKRGVPAVYMSWRQDSTELKGYVSDGKQYTEKIHRYKSAKVLYIDDFFKSGRMNSPSDADVNLAFEIIAYRDQREDLKTIISSEIPLSQLFEIDVALAGRIKKMAKDYHISIAKSDDRNYRLKE